MAAVVEGLEPEATAAAAEDAAGDAAEAVVAGSRVPALLAGNRLSFDLCAGGCHQLLHLCAQQSPQLLQVEFLRLSTHEDPQLLEATLALVPWSLPHLRSLVLKGGQCRDALGACIHGALTTLPAGLSGLARLAHLDLSFNSLETLPGCVLQMQGLDALLLSHNHLSELPGALGALPSLTFLTVTHNCLQTLPTALGTLSTLQRLDLSKNLLDTLPPEIGGLSSLSELNLASNRLQSLPASLAGLRSLRLLVLHSNLLASVPAGLARLPLLARLDLRDNRLRDVPPELLDAPFVRLQGNPLGEPLSEPSSPPGISPVLEMPRLFLTSDLDSFPVTPQGCSVTLACGVRLQFPAGATTTPITVHYRLLLPEPGLVHLGPHDALLSGVLELQPHRVAFQQDVGLWLLFVPPRARRCREVVVRTCTDNSWDDLETHLKEETPKRLWAHCQVPHFSWFLVVSRPVSNACLVTTEGTLLCSSGHPGVKVTFPPGATEEPRRVSMQVVHMASRELQALLGEPEAAVSPLLCLSQSGPPSFLQPVTVQLPLPSGVTGLSLDRSCLHLLYWAPPAVTWDDITAQVVLELTHLYARFQVTHFSWLVFTQLPQSPSSLGTAPLIPSPTRYWLWYTTKTCVGGLARKAWERLRLHRVNLIALQRRRDPEQVLLQCLPQNKVSFYRGTVPVQVPEEAEAARRKKGTNTLWMATLLIKLPRLRGSEGHGWGASPSLAPLNLGDAENGFLTQSNLLSVAGRLGVDWPAVALHLGVPYRELQRIRHNFRDDLDGQIRHMLFSWAERQAGQPGAVGLLVQALEQSDRQDVAEEVRAVLELGRRKYQDGIRRTGLVPEDPALPSPSAPQSPEPAQA
ncbi:p53-induced death domain-containing protein 1 isoform X5 [Nycticebus coucang]|uniref:p53-induced death domain-containing protein 1 isoform X5 n=1 Tax=Nycticebus coucang TaxID=9470 RepID=UPI00234D6E56|nr:p53-induced death domain-containing protein 1 isoform X5 [Nycticebus coucang]